MQSRLTSLKNSKITKKKSFSFCSLLAYIHYAVPGDRPFPPTRFAVCMRSSRQCHLQNSCCPCCSAVSQQYALLELKHHSSSIQEIADTVKCCNLPPCSKQALCKHRLIFSWLHFWCSKHTIWHSISKHGQSFRMKNYSR